MQYTGDMEGKYRCACGKGVVLYAVLCAVCARGWCGASHKLSTHRTGKKPRGQIPHQDRRQYVKERTHAHSTHRTVTDDKDKKAHRKYAAPRPMARVAKGGGCGPILMYKCWDTVRL